MSGLVSGAALLGTANLLSRVLLFVGLALIARRVPVAEFGTLSIVNALGTAAFAASEWGFDLTALRAYARRPQAIARTLGALILPRLAIAAAGFVVFVLIGTALHVADTALLATVVAAYVLSALARSLRAPFVATGRVRVEAVLGTAERIVGFVLIAVAVLFLGAGLWAYGASLLLAAVLALAASWRAVGRQWSVRPRRDVRRWRALLASATPMGVNTLAVWVYYRANLLLVSMLAGPAAAGVLGAVSLVPMAAGVAAQGAVQSLVPRLARLDRAEPAHAHALAQLVRYAGQAALCGAISLSVAAPWIVEAAFGHAYAAGTETLRLLSFHVFFLVTTPLLATLLRVHGARWAMARFAVLGALGSLVAGAMLVPRWGTVGAAAATLVGEGVVFVLCLRRTRVLLRATAFVRDTRLPGPAAIGAASCLAGLYSPLLQWLSAPVLIACVAATWRRTELRAALARIDSPAAA